MQKLIPVLSLIGGLWVIAAGVLISEQPLALIAGGVISLIAGILGLATSALKKPEQPADPDERPPAPVAVPPVQATAEERLSADALVLTSLLQEKGRFLDFLMDDITAYPDAQVGAAARVIHQGCKSVVLDAFAPTAVTEVAEQSSITLDTDFDKTAYRLSGNIAGEPPYTGTVEHKGWRPTQYQLPEYQGTLSSAEDYVFAPAQVGVRS
jgi:hypothetical protein